MELEEKIEQLETELAQVKVDIKQVLVDLKELIARDENPLSGAPPGGITHNEQAAAITDAAEA